MSSKVGVQLVEVDGKHEVPLVGRHARGAECPTGVHHAGVVAAELVKLDKEAGEAVVKIGAGETALEFTVPASAIRPAPAAEPVKNAVAAVVAAVTGK